MLRNSLAHIACRYLIRELPGWGHVYKFMVGGHEKQAQWAYALPRIIRDKRNDYIRVL